MLDLLRQHPWHFIGACIFGACAAIFAMVPFVVGWMVVLALLEGLATSSSMAMALVMLVGGVVMRHACFAASTTLSHFAAFDVQVDLRRRMTRQLFRVPLGLLDRSRESQWRTVLLDDVEAIEDGLAHLVPEIAAAAGGTVVAVILMMWADWRLAFAATIPLLVAMLVMQRMQRRAANATDAYRNSWEEMNSASSELARGITVLRIFNDGNQVSERFYRSCRDFMAAVQEWVRVCLAPGNVFSVLIGSSLVVVLPLALALIGWNISSPENALLVVFLCFGLGENFVRLGELSARIGRQKAALQRIGEALEAPQISYGGKIQPLSSTDLVFDNVSFAYEHTAALSDVSFTIPRGRVAAFVGASGSGKSTVARLAARLFDPCLGMVSVGGIDLRAFSSEQMGQLVATVFQDPMLFSDTIAANIRIGRMDASDAEIEEAGRLAQLEDIVSSLPDGYQSRLIEGGKNLSLGQRQRIAIARAIVSQAPILVLDEVTSFTDPETETLVQRALSNLVSGRAIVTIAHRLRTVAGADEIFVLDDGRIIERGRHEELLARGDAYARLWHAQTQDTVASDLVRRRHGR